MLLLDFRADTRVRLVHERSQCWVTPVLFPTEVTTQNRFGDEAEAHTHIMIGHVPGGARREAQRKDRIPPVTMTTCEKYAIAYIQIRDMKSFRWLRAEKRIKD